jgi:hypothetical protein
MMTLTGLPADEVPPSVVIQAPRDGAFVSGTVPVETSASDDTGVSRVEFSVDGRPVGTDSQAPFGFDWDTNGLADGTHTVSATAAVPVVAVARIPGVLRCPPCAEPIVAQSTGMGSECDRCGSLTDSGSKRVAALTGSSLIVVAQLCAGCRSRVLELVDDSEPS